MPRLGIHERLVLATGGLVALALLIGVLGITDLNRTRADAALLSERAEPSVILLLNLDRDSYQAQLGLERALSAQSEADREAGLQDFRSNATQVRERFAAYRQIALSAPGEDEFADRFEELRLEWMGRASGLATDLEAGLPTGPDELEETQAAFSAAREHLDHLYAKFYEFRIAEISSDVQERADQDARILIGGVALLSLALGLMAIWVSRMVRPLRSLSESARELASGGISPPAPGRARNDEVGMLSESFERMTSFLIEMRDTLTTVSAGDLSREVHVRGEHDEIGAAVRAMVRGLRGVVGDVLSAIQQVEASTQSLGTANRSLDASIVVTMQQADSMAKTTRSMEQTIRELARGAQRVAQEAGQAESQAAETTQVIGKLHHSSREIGAVTDVITEIAEQTNLLALNANIEAARAGELGKGFSVVADEVKQLAAETGKATSRVRDIVEAIQSDTRTAVEAVRSMAELVESIHRHGIQSADAVAQQERSVLEIGTSSAEVVRATKDTRTSSELTLNAARELQELAGALNRSAQRFRI